MNNPFNYFDKIFCINLQHRTDRWANCQDTFEKLGIYEKVTRLEGVNCLELYKTENLFANYFNNGIPNHIDIINLRRAGCALSFIQAVQQAKQKGYKNILIFEDDISLYASVPDTITTLNNCLTELPDNWELFYLSANPTSFHGHIQPITPYSQNLCYIHAAFCCHSIAINSNIYNYILDSFHSHIDIFDWVLKNVNFDTFCLKYIQPRNSSYMPKKLLFTQYTNYSDIEDCVRPNQDFILQSYQNYEHITP
jgi:GR25 family glycosyltransferase involved in LPS biosynthesis